MTFLQNCFDEKQSNLAILSAKYNDVPSKSEYPYSYKNLLFIIQNMCLIVDPKKRASIDDIIDAIHALLNGESLESVSPKCEDKNELIDTKNCVSEDTAEKNEENNFCLLQTSINNSSFGLHSFSHDPSMCNTKSEVRFLFCFFFDATNILPRVKN